VNNSLTEQLINEKGIRCYSVEIQESSPKKVEKSKYNNFNKFGIEFPYIHQNRFCTLFNK